MVVDEVVVVVVVEVVVVVVEVVVDALVVVVVEVVVEVVEWVVDDVFPPLPPTVMQNSNAGLSAVEAPLPTNVLTSNGALQTQRASKAMQVEMVPASHSGGFESSRVLVHVDTQFKGNTTLDRWELKGRESHTRWSKDVVAQDPDGRLTSIPSDQGIIPILSPDDESTELLS